jgi:hypothetical protein
LVNIDQVVVGADAHGESRVGAGLPDAREERGSVAGVHLLEADLALLLVAAVDHDHRAFPHEGVGDPSSDAPGAAGDGGDLAVELAHGLSPGPQ